MRTAIGFGPVSSVLKWAPLTIFIILIAAFGTLSPRFLSVANLGAILVQSSWLVVVALGMNFVLLAAGVDLSVGAAMYLAAIAVGIGLPNAPVWLGLISSILVGAAFGAINASLIAWVRLPAFIATLALLFVGRGVGLFFSSTRIVYASPGIANFGRDSLLGLPVPIWIAATTVAVAWLLLNQTSFGPYLRSVGADAEGARRSGVPTKAITWSVYVLCGALAGLGGLISLSQTSAASAAFGQNSEFLAIAAAVLGGTSLSGGRGSLWAPVIGAVLIMTVQNGLVMINANPYAYPVITGAVIFVAALLDSIRSRTQARLERRQVRPNSTEFVIRGSAHSQ
jgi:ribose/xylose/arabinose/galactoside ABC-type transport system permease subunit